MRVFSTTGAPLASFFAYDASFTGGVRVAAAGSKVITGAGPGGGPHVRAFEADGTPTATSFFAYDASFTGGVYVSAGDVDADGSADIVTGAGAGGGPHVQVFSADGTNTLASFFAYAPAFTGGVYVGGK